MDHCSFEFAAYNDIVSAGAMISAFSELYLCRGPIKDSNSIAISRPFKSLSSATSGQMPMAASPLGKAELYQFVNNIVYDYGYGMDTGNPPFGIVFSNFFIAGPATTNTADAYYQVDGNQKAYAIGNYLD